MTAVILALVSRTGGAANRATSDSSGLYRFDGLPPGDYILRAQAPDFKTFLAENVHLAPGKPRTIDIPLQVGELIQQVSVTASSTPQSPEEVSKALTVIDQTEAQQRDDSTLADVLRLTPGLRIEQLGGPGAFTGIHLRGLRNEDTAVLIDGLRLRDAASTQADASGLIDDMLIADASRVEVLRGSGSSLYGTNAIGGVINVITDAGGGRTRGSLLVEGGSLGTFRGRALIAGGLNGDRIQYSAGFTHLNVSDGVGGDDPYRDTNAQAHVAFRLSPSTRLAMRFYAGDAFGKVRSEPVSTGTLPASGIIDAVPFSSFIPAPDDPDSTRATRFISDALFLTGQPSPALAYSLSYQLLASSRRFSDGPAGVGFQPDGSTRSLYDGRIQTVNARLDYRLGSFNLVTGGYEFEHENFANDNTDSANAAASSGVRVSESSQSYFAQDQVRLFGDRLQLSGAFRAQYFMVDQPSFSPAASAPFLGVPLHAPAAAYTGDGSAAWFFQKSGTKVRVHAGRGYRAPSLFERFGAGYDPTFGYSVYGDPRLAPERSIAFDAGADQSLLQGRVRASATYFYTQLQEVIIFDFSGFLNPATDPFGRAVGYRNTQGGLARGVELDASVSPIRSLNISTAYTFANASERAPIVGDVLRSFVIPRNQFSVVATERAGSRLLLTCDLLASSDYLAPVVGDVTRVYRFGGIHKMNLGASYRFPRAEQGAVRVFARMENVFGQDYFESGFQTPGRTAIGGMQFEF